MWRVPIGMVSTEFWNLRLIICSISWACPARVCNMDRVVSRNVPIDVFAVLYTPVFGQFSIISFSKMLWDVPLTCQNE